MRSRGLLVFALFALSGTIAGAQTFNWTVNCPAVTVGPVTVLAQFYSGTVTLTTGSASTAALLPTNNLTRVDDPAAAPGTYNGSLSCTLTFDGVTMPFTRSLSLDVPSGNMTTGATTFTVDLGAHGGLDVSAPADTTEGWDGSLIAGSLLSVPLISDTTLLLGVAVPLPTWSLVLDTILPLLVGVALLQRRRWRTVG